MEPYVFGYPLRQPSDSETEFFRKNRKTAGYAAPDGAIVLNPLSSLSEEQRMAVAQNEAARLWMREKNYEPGFDLTPEQQEAFKGTPYESDGTSLRQSILGRIISGDPSAGNATPIQREHAEWVRQRLMKRR